MGYIKILWCTRVLGGHAKAEHRVDRVMSLLPLFVRGGRRMEVNELCMYQTRWPMSNHKFIVNASKKSSHFQRMVKVDVIIVAIRPRGT